MLEFQLLIMDGPMDYHNSACNDPMSMAEYEFATFTKAVSAMFGTAQATQAAEDWMNELASRDRMPEATSPEWRLITLAALARLTIRMSVVLHSQSCIWRDNGYEAVDPHIGLADRLVNLSGAPELC